VRQSFRDHPALGRLRVHLHPPPRLTSHRSDGPTELSPETSSNYTLVIRRVFADRPLAYVVLNVAALQCLTGAAHRGTSGLVVILSVLSLGFSSGRRPVAKKRLRPRGVPFLLPSNLLGRFAAGRLAWFSSHGGRSRVFLSFPPSHPSPMVAVLVLATNDRNKHQTSSPKVARRWRVTDAMSSPTRAILPQSRPLSHECPHPVAFESTS